MCPTNSIKDLIYCIVDIFLMRGIIPLMMGLALVFFLWGVFKFVRDAGDDKARTEGKKFMFWGIMGIFIMLCVWAFVEILAGTFFDAPVFIPQVII
jgi:hypothetical protein